jgi:hypothetical protein
MKDAYNRHISSDERARIAKLEIFDEVEEWELMGDHYCVSWAVSAVGDSVVDDLKWLAAIDLPKFDT